MIRARIRLRSREVGCPSAAVTGTKVASYYVSFYLLLLLEIYMTFRLTRVHVVSIFRFTTTGLRSSVLTIYVA